MYSIVASITHDTEMGLAKREIPMFYIDNAVNEEQAREVARKIIDPFRRYDHRLTISVAVNA